MTFLESLKVAKILWSFIKELFFSKVESTKDKVKNLLLVICVILTIASFVGGVSLRDVMNYQRDNGKIILDRREYWRQPEHEDPLLDFMERNLRVQLRETTLLQIQLEQSLEKIEAAQNLEDSLREQIQELHDEIERIESEFQSSGNPREMYDNLRHKPRG